MRVRFLRMPGTRIGSPPRFSTMPRKRAVANGVVETSPTIKSISMTSAAAATATAAMLPPPSRKTSARSVTGTKRTASPPAEEPLALKRNISSATVLEATEAREASPDESESQNPDLDSSDQATQPRLPAVNSDILPLPWKGRLGYACLNTVLRDLKPPIFCSRTCRMDTINGTPKKEGKGLEFAKDLGRQNAADLSRILEWNERFGIRFMRLSSEMFPFASHAELGYTLEFAKPELAAAGRIAMKYGHRLTMHPGQFTQIASPKENVVTASIRDLEYHAELIELLGLEGQIDRDAVMILHMGGMYGDKNATLMRFKENYVTLSERVKKRLVLENDDMCWSVEDLLPTCQELGIPMVLDWHHNNVIPGSMREGTQDILRYVPAITALWHAKNITPKQHYSEPRAPEAIIRRDLRPHSKRVHSLPPCSPDMDLMIEAKDKEQAVFELRRKWNIEGAVPEEWILRGEKMDEDRQVPSYEGQIAYYEEGEEWRFKPPIKMPVKVSNVLEKLDKEKLKLEKLKEKLGEDNQGELGKIEMEFMRIDEDKKKVLEDWEREKRVKWGLEKKKDEEGNDITPVTTPKRKSKAKKKTVVKDEDEDDEEDDEVDTDMVDDSLVITGPRATPKRVASGRGRKSYAEMEGSEDELLDEKALPVEKPPKEVNGRARRKTSEMDLDTAAIPTIIPQVNGAAAQKVEGGGKKRKVTNEVKIAVEELAPVTETVVRRGRRTGRAKKIEN